MNPRYVTGDGRCREAYLCLEWDEVSGRNDPRQRFALYRLCECSECGGAGKVERISAVGSIEPIPHRILLMVPCSECHGKGEVLDLVATCESPEAAGVALVTLGREGEWDNCPVGLLDRQGEVGRKWLIRPWLPSPRNVSNAGRMLRTARKSSA